MEDENKDVDKSVGDSPEIYYYEILSRFERGVFRHLFQAVQTDALEAGARDELALSRDQLSPSWHLVRVVHGKIASSRPFFL